MQLSICTMEGTIEGSPVDKQLQFSEEQMGQRKIISALYLRQRGKFELYDQNKICCEYGRIFSEGYVERREVSIP